MIRENATAMIATPPPTKMGNSSEVSARSRTNLLKAESLDARSAHDCKAHSTPAAIMMTIPKIKIIGSVVIPTSKNTPPTASASGHMLFAGATTFAVTASFGESTSKSPVNCATPPTSDIAIAIPSSASTPTSDGFTNTMYTTAPNDPRPAMPKQYFDPVVNMSSYFCTYTTNHTAQKTAVRTYQYNA